MALELIKNDREIEALKPGLKRLNDGGGLYLLPFAKGLTHYWRLDYVFEGRRKTLSLGVYPNIGLSDARKKAAEALANLSTGVDPSSVRKVRRQQLLEKSEAEARELKGLLPLSCFEETARRWFSVKEGQWMYTYSSKVLRRLELHAFPLLGAMPMASISPSKILEVCRRVEDNDTLETAHRLREHCSAVFRFAIVEGENLRDPCIEVKDALKRPPVRHFGAVTKPDMLAELLRAIENYRGSFVVRSALQLAPMLMVRPGELRLAGWEEFDLDNQLWYVPSIRMKRTKEEKLNGQPHFVPLPRQAVDVLEALFLRTGPTGQLFPAEGRAGRFMSENTMNAALRAMGYNGDIVTPHGFRATARTLVVEVLQYPESVVEMQLAHAVKDANGTAYNRTEFIRKRIEMMQSWADYLEDLRLGRKTAGHPVLPTFQPVTRRSSAISGSPNAIQADTQLRQ
jgi:integrase